MLDRVELRRREEGGQEARVVADIHEDGARLDVTVNGKRTKHDVDAARFDTVSATLEGAAIAPVPAHAREGAPVGFEVILTTGMSQSVFRWVGATPATWEPVARMADALLVLGRELSRAV
jgi:hypothetical protein